MEKFFLALLLLFQLSACGESSDDKPAKSARAPDPERGRSIYLSNCAACHNADPSKNGPVGPAIKGSSLELIEARVMRAAYPPGYKPKRTTALMPAQPYLKSAIPDLAAFLR